MANPIDFVTNEYTVFEADQVLTNKHLNQLFNYLDQQNRWTRNKLIGIGIVCGLDIVYDAKNKPGIIEVTPGCGVTSQGYLIILEEPKANEQSKCQYTYYMPYAAIDEPEDLPFTYPGNLPFYKPYCADKSVFLLLTDDDYDALENNAKGSAQTISAAADNRMLNDYVVVLFLEMSELDLKNCDTFDCNNKGEKMTLTIRPLLVKKTDLPVLQEETPEVGLREAISKTKFTGTTAIKATRQTLSKSATGIGVKTNLLSGAIGKGLLHTLNTFTNKAPEINLKRFNVPYTDLKATDDIINAFLKIVDDATLTDVAGAYNYCYGQYKSLLGVSANPFGDLLDNLKMQRDEIVKKYPIFIQYFYDFIDDLIKAYYEFRVKVSELLSACCPDENLFPLHLVLGEATTSTKDFIKDPYRTYFIYSPLFAKQENEVSESVFLFRRMQIMASKFTVLNPAQVRAALIKIQPSVYEQAFLSQRAIPYYYIINEAGNELYKYWSYYKTIRGNAAFNLSYNANLYNNNTAVLQPLLYDIERFNFFRIEGHIGTNYQTALSNILQQRQTYNLPFDVVAISADQLPAGTGTLPQCNMQDLDTDYQLIISEFSCKVHTPFCFVTKFPFPPPATGVITGATNVTASNIANNVSNIKLQSFSNFKLAAAENLNVNLSAFAVLQKVYTKGDFMRKYCPPTDGTVGSAYLNALNGNVFTNPIQLNPRQSSLLLYYYIFEYIDSVEDLMSILIPNTLATLDMDAFKTAYARFVRNSNLVTIYIGQWLDGNFPDNENLDWLKDVEMDILMNEFTFPPSACIDERLQTLLDEYKSRLQLYELQRSFYYYYNKHYGLEHKAGVPKGGTFVLVYHPAARRELTSSTGITGTRATAGLSAAAALQREGTTGANAGVTSAKLFMAKSPKITPEKAKVEKVKATGKAAATTERTTPPASGTIKAANTQSNKTATAAAKSNVKEAEKHTAAGAAFNSAALDINTLETIKSFAASATDISAENRKAILDFLASARAQVVTSKYAVADDVVIADFYVPYLCCSDCAPVTYVLPPSAEEPPEFDIEPKEFLFDDAHNYAFTAKPPVTDKGEEQNPFSSPNVLNPDNVHLLADANNVLYLHPAMPELDKTLKATITYKNIPVNIIIIKPDATFSINEIQNAAGETLLQLVPFNKDADKYEWTVNDIEGIFQNTVNPDPVSLGELQSKTDSTAFTIALTVTYTRNEVTAEDTKTKEYQIPQAIVCIDFEPPLKIGTEYGEPAQQRPGDEAFTTPEKITVRVWDFKFEGEGGTFNVARVVTAPGGFTNSQCLFVNNITMEFDYSNTRALPAKVEVDFLDAGGSNNLSVNDSELFRGKLSQAPAELGGVSVTVKMGTGDNERRGTLTLAGKEGARIKTFRIGGQEFFIDNVCAQ